MPHIQQLDPHVADLIAAGEVVERPASVVKELLENSIDAGASAVTVEIRNGGMTFIRVTDDGCGISPDEAETAFLRHATSKIRTEYDLEAIGTLGFRGEALAAVAAVSRVDLLTRTQDAPLGAALSLEGGVVTSREESGCPVGTTLVVRDLFYNTPARLKFVKRDAAEGAAVFAVVQREALAHPEVSFTFLREGRAELRTPGDGQMKSALYSVLGRDLALGFTPAKGSGEGGISVEGFVSLPTCCRGTRGYQHFFVNGRYVKSKTMTAALEQAYQNQKMVGKFPGCVLYVTTKLSAVDVNVHPTKTEVKFASERQIFDAVYHAALSALTQDRTRPALWVPKPKAADMVTPAQTTLPLHDAARPTSPPLPAQERAPHVTIPPAGMPVRTQTPAARSPVSPSPLLSSPSQTEKPPGQIPRPAPPPPRAQAQEPAGQIPRPAPARRAQEAPAVPQEQPWRVAGQVLDTYIIVEQGEHILFIDKHAAHERMWFDKLKSQNWRPMGQRLLTPIVFTPPPEEGAVLLEHLPLLAEFGFEVEEFGGGAVIVRQVPHDIDADQAQDALTQLAVRLLTTGGRADPDAARDELLHTMACKAAIKGGQKNAPAELERVAQAVMSGAVKYCPHGRPVAVELTRAQLEKQFKRT